MTIIVASRSEGVMVGDTLVVSDDGSEIVGHTEKIIKGPRGVLAGIAGNNAGCGALLRWVEQGWHGDPDEDWFADAVLLLMSHDWIRRYDCPRPDTMLGDLVAIGAGTPFAHAAHFLGHSALDAVRCAIHLSPLCGGEPTILKLSESDDPGLQSGKKIVHLGGSKGRR